VVGIQINDDFAQPQVCISVENSSLPSDHQELTLKVYKMRYTNRTLENPEENNAMAVVSQMLVKASTN